MSTANRDAIYLYVWSGDAREARKLTNGRYPGVAIQEFPHRRMRESKFVDRVRLLHGFRGRAVVFYFESLRDFKYKQILGCVHLLHSCRETVLCDRGGQWETLRTLSVLRTAPALLISFLMDLKTLLFWRFYLQLRLMFAAPVAANAGKGNIEVAYLIPSLAGMGSSGGAISHIRGFLFGLKRAAQTCRVFSGTPLAQNAFETEVIAPSRQPYFFWEASMLSYNRVFARGVEKQLAREAPKFLYQRHCRFAVAGALLSRRLKIPLIVEYNGPQGWIADHWDPTRFRSWLTLCEEVTLRSAARIVVVSEALEAELLVRNIPAERIRVNPNGVDPDFFYPGRGRDSGRGELGIGQDEVLIGFAGSFSLWHGVEVLAQAISQLLNSRLPCRLRFVLMGHGLLHEDMRSALKMFETTGEVIFTGSLPSQKVAEYLDAADILVSPHIPMPDGSRFFGSPTKLFEYMAMGKGIIASRLEQIAEVLQHDRTAWLVSPGDVDELASAMVLLATDPAKREALGLAARHAAVERHSWARNVSWALGDMPTRTDDHEVLMSTAGGSTLTP